MKCKFCEKTFLHEKGLLIHISMIHKSKIKQEKLALTGKTCRNCRKVFIPERGGNQGSLRLCCSKVCAAASNNYGKFNCTSCGVEIKRNSSSHKLCKDCKTSQGYRYGLSAKQTKELIAKTSGKCTLCDRDAKHIDHDHKTGKVRGMLCPRCNTALSAVEIPGWTEVAMLYLKCDL